jgi:hypothetical protein
LLVVVRLRVRRGVCRARLGESGVGTKKSEGWTTALSGSPVVQNNQHSSSLVGIEGSGEVAVRASSTE